MITMEEELINVFFAIDEKLKVFNHESHYHTNFSDSEVLTLLVIKVIWTMKSDKKFHRLIKEKFLEFFPKLPEYSRYMKRAKKISYIAFKLIEEFSFEERNELFIIDTKPIPLLERTRANRSILVKIFRQWRINPEYGYCAAKKEKYFGFKLVALWNKGRIVCYSLVSANASEQECLMELIKRNNLMNIKIFGDKGFIMKLEDKQKILKQNIIIEAIPRKNMRIIIENLSFKKYIRKKIETCFSVLKESFDLENIVFRSIFGVVCAINQRILAYNLRHLIKADLKIS